MPFQVSIDRDADIDALKPSDVRRAIAERSEFLHNIFEEAGADLDHTKVKVVDVKDGRELAAQIDQRNNELSKLGARQAEIDRMEVARTSAENWRNSYAEDPAKFAPKTPSSNAAPQKHWTAMLAESEAYANAKKGGSGNVMLPVSPISFLGSRPINATFLTTSGWAPETLRTGRVVLDEQREIEVTDILPMFPTDQAAVVYMEETTFTSAAAERSENASYAESTLILTERSVTVQSVGSSLPVTDEQLADVTGTAAYLDARLGFMVRQRLDSQILVGNGTPPNLAGTLNVAGINSQAKGVDSAPDAIYKGIKAARVTGRSQPNVVIIHPNDWEPIRLLKTADGIYIWGSPSEAGPKMIWGLPVVETTAVTENTAIAGDYARFSGLHIRSGLEVLTGYVSNDFLQGRRTIRAGLRCAVVHYRPSAFTQITGL